MPILKSFNVVTALSGSLLAGFLMAGTAMSAETEDTIKYRHAAMEAMSGHVASFLLIATNKIEAPEFLQSHADALVDLSRQLNLMFPEGSGGEDTHALPAIWEDPEGFSAAVIKMQETASALQLATRAGNKSATMKAFAEAGKSCKGCHEDYREEHDH
ncbi:MAG: cytochrome c [Gammaproteobacteria bacterium]|nr:cytochrome c [Gammaproteobacteria bacterium]